MIKGLDNYLTQEPPDNSWWFEKCADLIPENVHSLYETTIEKWMEGLFEKDYTPEKAARIINLALEMRIKAMMK